MSAPHERAHKKTKLNTSSKMELLDVQVYNLHWCRASLSSKTNHGHVVDATHRPKISAFAIDGSHRFASVAGNPEMHWFENFKFARSDVGK